MLLSWIGYLFRHLGRFIEAVFAIALAPGTFARNIDLNDKSSFFRAMNFWLTGLGVLFVFSFVGDSITDYLNVNKALLEVLPYVWQLFLCFLGYLFLLAIGGRGLTFTNYVHCYAYVTTADSLLGSLLSVPLSLYIMANPLDPAIVQQMNPGITHDMIRAYCQVPSAEECQMILRLETGQAGFQILTIAAAVALTLYMGYVLGRFLQEKAQIAVWRGLVSYLLVLVAFFLLGSVLQVLPFVASRLG